MIEAAGNTAVSFERITMPQDKEWRNKHLRVKYGPFKDIFFYYDKPYKRLSQSMRKNRVVCWDIEEKKKVILPYNSWKSKHKKAFNTSEAARILNRHRTKLYKWVKDGNIPSPYRVPPSHDDNHYLSNGSRLLWQEKDFRNAIEFIESTGKWRDWWPTWEEVSANINDDETIRFIMDEKTGEFIPIWRAD